MKKSIGFCEFTDSFRGERSDTFSYNGLKALYEYLEQYEEDTVEEIELDTIALCCEFTEYDSIREAYEVYKDDYDTLCEEEDERDERANEYLIDNTQVIHIDN